MTTLTFVKRDGDIVSVEAVGHSGYAEHGSDIVCAAISAAMQLCDAALRELDAGFTATVDDEKTLISLKIHRDSAKAQPILQALQSVAAQWQKQYSNYIRTEIQSC